MTKIIFVNATATTEGGALTILRQFLDGINKYSNKDRIYYVFCSLIELEKYENENIKIINDIKAKKWLDRIKWDFWRLKQWSKKNNLKPNLVISFQNTGVKYLKEIPQIIYLHQSLSFYSKNKWNLFNKDERAYWFYQNIYPLFIKLSLPKRFVIVVQAEVMKNRVKKLLHLLDEQIVVINPSFKSIDISLIKPFDFSDNKFHIFYPAATYIYKNHEIIIKALKYIKNNFPEIYKNLLVHFTFSTEGEQNQKLVSLINNLEVQDVIKLEGNLDYQKVLQFYKSVNLVVFPSYIESFPLPLLETAIFGLPLLVSDMDFSREIISDYKGAQFLDYKDDKLWAEKIIECYKQKPRFKPFQPQLNTSWKDFFELVNKSVK